MGTKWDHKPWKTTYQSAMHEVHGSNIYTRSTLQPMLNLLGVNEPKIFSPSDAQDFITQIVKDKRPSFILEVRVFLGKTSIQLAKALDLIDAPKGSFVMSLDTWLGDTYMWSSKRGRKCAECADTYFDTLLSAHGKPLFYYQFLYNVKWPRQNRCMHALAQKIEAQRALEAAK